MSESPERPANAEIPMAVLDQVAFQLGKGIIAQTLAEYHAGMNGSEASRLRSEVQDGNDEIERLAAHNRTLESQLRALSENHKGENRHDT